MRVNNVKLKFRKGRKSHGKFSASIYEALGIAEGDTGRGVIAAACGLRGT